MSKRSFSPELKIEVLKVWDEDFYSLADIAKKYKVAMSTIREWKYKYEQYGSEGLKESSTWKPYTHELKLNAVKDYLSGEYSRGEIVRKYEISSRSVLKKWIRKYNSHSELKDTSLGRTSTMTNGRKTTWEERIQIALDCLGNKKDYQTTAETYQVSYQQVYQWVKKYEDGGEEALRDKRGRKKDEVELTPEEKTKFEMKKLERENERLRAENLFLKKLEEIERRRK